MKHIGDHDRALVTALALTAALAIALAIKTLRIDDRLAAVEVEMKARAAVLYSAGPYLNTAESTLDRLDTLETGMAGFHQGELPAVGVRAPRRVVP